MEKISKCMPRRSLLVWGQTPSPTIDWWGCFVLPDTVTVKDITSYSDTTLLSLNYDYTITHINNFNIACVRIPSDVNKLSLLFGLVSTVDIDPDVLNIKSQGKWITSYIELPDSYDVNNIDISTIELRYGRDKVSAELHPTQINDYDNDGIPDLMVKFNREEVLNLFSSIEPPFDAELQVTGYLIDETPFAGTDIIRVISGRGGQQIAGSFTTDIPKAFSLSQNNPNPFRNRTTIMYCLPKSENVMIQIYNTTGRLIRTILSERQEAGYKSFTWDGKDNLGRKVPGGIYFCRLKAGNFEKIRKLVVLKEFRGQAEK